MDQQQKIATVNNIKAYEDDIIETKRLIAVQKESIQDILEATDGWLDTQSLKEQYEQSKLSLNLKLMNGGDYSNALEVMGQLKLKLKDQQQIQSDFIVAYYGQTQERQIEMNNSGDARNIILKGKLGKKDKYQLSLLSDYGKTI